MIASLAQECQLSIRNLFPAIPWAVEECKTRDQHPNHVFGGHSRTVICWLIMVVCMLGHSGYEKRGSQPEMASY